MIERLDSGEILEADHYYSIDLDDWGIVGHGSLGITSVTDGEVAMHGRKNRRPHSGHGTLTPPVTQSWSPS